MSNIRSFIFYPAVGSVMNGCYQCQYTEADTKTQMVVIKKIFNRLQGHHKVNDIETEEIAL